ncbi:MAG: hypothetical protein COU90_03200 [Candidatus Ryanbacteria bacterium CG10_big_fil_rev_8_21_14_0_10_43_42]|uniref:EF-hand domain-containing protein n=1 Tax=Candidatus Ryanbacteria bacterium CG10_big_fil_rev_8_21_14_0_10_43_42 TaxID=1974864 RepID=A0A2M8KWW9_9BACT|nr:MAG: hypothetical protein COU90_03200 [Candidatus Ryanbacteria bacterium CG10_big_fil_rev_8_21_14_0_10_43_42]
MGIFFTGKKKITREEFRDSLNALRHERLNDSDINDLKNIFSGSLNEKHDDKGIDGDELKKTIELLKKNKGTHNLSKAQIEKAEKNLKKRL